MKTIYKSFIAFAAALLLVPVAHAQRDIPYVDKDSFGYNKYVVNDNPNSKGEYTLRIETFLTGTVETKQVAVPSDIILVLDASGSMNECYIICYEFACAIRKVLPLMLSIGIIDLTCIDTKVNAVKHSCITKLNCHVKHRMRKSLTIILLENKPVILTDSFD